MLVSGGTHGIGKAIAITLANEGCKVAVFSSNENKVKAMSETLSSITTNFLCMVGDVFDKNSYEKIYKSIKSNWGGVDILINNVGGGGRWGSECFLETDELVWEEVLEKNLFSSVRYAKLFLPFMMKNNWGRVINITSIYGKEIGGRPWFNIAKASQNVFTKNLSKMKKYSSRNITFNSVAPGPVYIKNTGWSTFKEEDPKAFEQYVKDNIPRGKMATPEEVAKVVLFLCTDDACLINGTVISCDGGQGVCL